MARYRLPRLWPRSLTLCLALLAAVWMAGGLSVAGWFASSMAARQMLAAFDQRLNAALDDLAGAVSFESESPARPSRGPGGSRGPAGEPAAESVSEFHVRLARRRSGTLRAMAGAEFQEPLSGFYWQVSGPPGPDGKPQVQRSRSLWDAEMPQPAGVAPPIAAADGARFGEAMGPRDRRLRMVERVIELPEAPGPLLLQVAMDRGAVDAEISRLHFWLVFGFGTLGLGLVAAVAGQVVLGLRPLRRVRRDLAALRAGKRARLSAAGHGAARLPAELAPLVTEIDALVEQNHATVERARAHVGNLAHALKTPLAVLRVAAEGPLPDLATVRDQAAALDRLLQHHLARARAAALAGAARADSAPLAVADEIAAALRRLHAEDGITIAVEGDAASRVAVEKQDLAEMLGNLMENACKWATERVVVRVSADAVEVGDDGPGLPAAQREAAMARGVRLDEAAPGTGLGLAIVADLAALYGGRLRLDRDRLGGLLARLELPGRAAAAGA